MGNRHRGVASRNTPPQSKAKQNKAKQTNKQKKRVENEETTSELVLPFQDLGSFDYNMTGSGP